MVKVQVNVVGDSRRTAALAPAEESFVEGVLGHPKGMLELISLLASLADVLGCSKGAERDFGAASQRFKNAAEPLAIPEACVGAYRTYRTVRNGELFSLKGVCQVATTTKHGAAAACALQGMEVVNMSPDTLRVVKGVKGGAAVLVSGLEIAKAVGERRALEGEAGLRSNGYGRATATDRKENWASLARGISGFVMHSYFAVGALLLAPVVPVVAVALVSLFTIAHLASMYYKTEQANQQSVWASRSMQFEPVGT